ncbi:MAG: type II toxin-antitoxin system RelE/ParE family toxin [Pseudomonadota bacterium]
MASRRSAPPRWATRSWQSSTPQFDGDSSEESCYPTGNGDRVLTSERIRHKELRKLFLGKRSKVGAQFEPRLKRILASLNQIVSPQELTLYRCHALVGDRQGEYALHVTKNWRVTFRWDEHGPYDVDFEDYHG